MDEINPSEVRKALDEVPGEVLSATTTLTRTAMAHTSRRSLLHKTLAGAAGLTVAGALTATELLHAHTVHAEATHNGPDLSEYFSILATGEQLFATFYRLGITNAVQLGITDPLQLDSLQAILAEEEIHRLFAIALGGKPATNHFSFPFGAATFTDRNLFLQTQQLAEELTNGALLAWIRDMAAMNKPGLAQIGGQLMQVEGGHRVVGRVILAADPLENWAFGPVSLTSFLQVPGALRAAGFLSPQSGNDFLYQPTPPRFPGVIHTVA